MHIFGNDSCLVGLSNVSKYDIDHTNQKSIVLWLSGIVDYGDYISTLLRHVNQIATYSMGKLDTIDHSSGTDYV